MTELPRKDAISETTRLLDNDTIIETAAVDVFESVITDQDDPNESEDIRWLREERLSHQTKRWYNRPSVFLISLALLTNFLAMSIAITARLVIILQQICGNIKLKSPEMNDSCHDPRIQQELGSLQSALLFTSGVTSCLVSGKIGELSDRYGRKRMLLFSGCCSLIGNAMINGLLRPGMSYHRNVLLFANFIESVGGGNPVIIGVASSYITDIVEPHRRIVSLGFMIGTLYGGMALGPLIGNFVIETFNGYNFAALNVSLSLYASFVLILGLFVTESRSPKLRRKSQSTHLQRKASFASMQSERPSNLDSLQLWRLADIFAPLKTLWVPKHHFQGFKPRINVLILTYCDVCLFLLATALSATLIIYATYAFNWGSDSLGVYISVVGFTKGTCLYIVSPILLHILRKFIKSKLDSIDVIDKTVLLLALVFDAFGPLVVIFATNGNLLYLSAILASLGALGGPCIQSCIVKYVPETKVGEVFGAMALLKNIVLTVGSPVFLQIYSRSVSTSPTLVFWVIFIIFLSTLVATLFLQGHDSSQDPPAPLVRSGSTASSSSDLESQAFANPAQHSRRGSQAQSLSQQPLSQSPRR